MIPLHVDKTVYTKGCYSNQVLQLMIMSVVPALVKYRARLNSALGASLTMPNITS